VVEDDPGGEVVVFARLRLRRARGWPAELVDALTDGEVVAALERLDAEREEEETGGEAA
jgi:hypothetical protein